MCFRRTVSRFYQTPALARRSGYQSHLSSSGARNSVKKTRVVAEHRERIQSNPNPARRSYRLRSKESLRDSLNEDHRGRTGARAPETRLEDHRGNADTRSPDQKDVSLDETQAHLTHQTSITSRRVARLAAARPLSITSYIDRNPTTPETRPAKRSPSTATTLNSDDKTMLTEDIMNTLMGPIPTPFTGDLTLAQKFLDEFGQLDRANRRHHLITQPELRVELALALVEGPETDIWKSTVRRGHPTDMTDESIWDEFFDSFCTAWIDNAPMTPTILSLPRQYPPTPTVPLLPRADGSENEEALPDSTSTPLPVTLPTPVDKPLAPVIADPSLTSHQDRDVVNADIQAWIRQVIYEPPPCPRPQPRSPLATIPEEPVDPELREYGYDRTFDHADDED
ncbi:hypothetical protein EDB86DRAFT_2833313 [Lactarius hatsudake]|nr:hypothetical protein EDB86DRAFT_2833313 [Lactarius hatsudake]